ncbi:maturation protein [ssRNA phage SRR5466727_9]|uniref:Maturation protein n=1 Tax=ssRNA phage SRR5466727_9 TaxID=2786438 RepID=A0A8S5L0I4_9VIRU|nr:maturation protein [ssRNA phage SRR5466727_9]DAD50837.1 TPA_asm: maturation protein [ssRNA phage SRR5466727_9]
MSKEELIKRGSQKEAFRKELLRKGLLRSDSLLSSQGPLDPLGFYRLKVGILADNSAGLENLAYRIFGSDLIGSVALAINPLRQFLVADEKVSPVNRTRTFTAMGTPWARKKRHREIQIIGRSPPDVSTPNAFDRMTYSETVTVPSNTTTNLTSQSQVKGTVKDTTYRSRPIGNDQGEFELWKPRVRCPPATRNRVSLESNVYTTAGGYTYRSRDAEFMSDFTVGPAGYISPTSVDTLYSSERTLLLQKMSENALSMAARLSPARKEFSIGRSVAELRELPKSIKATAEAWLLARETLSRKQKLATRKGTSAPGEYVNISFGWLPIYRDIVTMLSLPERISRRVNRLMYRNGLDNTFRTGFSLGSSPVSSPPSFTFDLLQGESLVGIGTHGSREIELRGMINAGLRFPAIALPVLQRQLMRQAWGLYPDPEDVYNLVPWSWLVDWFTGLGDYVDAFNIVNRDPSIINFGFITGVSTGYIDTVQTSKATRIQKVSITPPVPATVFTENIVENKVRTGRLEWKLQIRSTFGSAYGLRPSNDLQLFSGDQLTILGAILTARY